MPSGLDQLWPFGNRFPGALQTKGVTDFRIQMQFHRKARILKRYVIKPVIDAVVHVVIFGLQQESWGASFW